MENAPKWTKRSKKVSEKMVDSAENLNLPKLSRKVPTGAVRDPSNVLLVNYTIVSSRTITISAYFTVRFRT